VYLEIKSELNKLRIKDFSMLTRNKMRPILKKLRFNKYYEHTPHIINKLNGLPPPAIDRETESELRKMFMMIQIPFKKHCPKKRKNFLSYSYVLHKCCQLLGLDVYRAFPLLKSRAKLQEHDAIWRGICRDLGWRYSRSI